MTKEEAWALEAYAFSVEGREAKADAFAVVIDAFEEAGLQEFIPVRRSWMETLRKPKVIGPVSYEEIREALGVNLGR